MHTHQTKKPLAIFDRTLRSTRSGCRALVIAMSERCVPETPCLVRMGLISGSRNRRASRRNASVGCVLHVGKEGLTLRCRCHDRRATRTCPCVSISLVVTHDRCSVVANLTVHSITGQRVTAISMAVAIAAIHHC
jgi:hypothetical protein